MQNDASFKPSRILCPIDFSEHSILAMKYAAAGARVFGSRLIVFHAQRFELPAYFTRAQAQELTRQHRAQQKEAAAFLRKHAQAVLGAEARDLPIHFEVRDSHPVDAVLGAIVRHRADLVVMGTHGRGGSQRLWLGSVAESVMRQAGVPVFIARQKQHEFIDTSKARAMPKLGTILCPVNFSEAARASLRHALSLAQEFGARLVTACVLERGDQRGAPGVRKELASWLAESEQAGCEVRLVARRGASAAAEVVALAGEVKADLVVVGAQPRKLLETWLWGDTTEFVLRHAPAPVLVVPH